jgi:hypothetical protein
MILDYRCFILMYPSGVQYFPEDPDCLGAEIACFGSKEQALLWAHEGVAEVLGIPMAEERPHPCLVLKCAGCDQVYDESEGPVHFRDRAQAWDCAVQIGWHVDGHETLCERCKPQPPDPALTDPGDGQEPLFEEAS